MQGEHRPKENANDKMATQYSTFYIAKRLYGIDVTSVQEVVNFMPITRVPLAPPYIIGLINLRGQIATAIGVRQMFGLPIDPDQNMMNVVCRAENMLLSLIVDEIGDVIEVEKGNYEKTPSTIPERTRQFLNGVYKTNTQLLSVIDLGAICKKIGLSNKAA